MNTIKSAALAAFACGMMFVTGSAAQKKQKDVTQTLQLPKELPNTVTGETHRLTFHVTPLSSKGLLSAQVRDALKALSRDTSGSTVLRIRAFVAGSGDLRRVRDLVSDTFTDRKQPLPALTLVQSGGLPMEGAQVVLEAVAQSKKEVNPQGIVIVAAPFVSTENPLDPVAPLAAKSLEQLKGTLQSAGTDTANVLRVTCFLSSLENLADSRKLVETEYPKAVLNFVQTQRAPGRALAGCEAVARAPAVPAKVANAVVLASPRAVFSGTQVSYGYQEADSRLAFDRLRKSLESSGVSGDDVVFAQYYPVAEPMTEQVRKLAPSFFGKSAGSVVLMEGLPSMQAGFAVDVIAAKN